MRIRYRTIVVTPLAIALGCDAARPPSPSSSVVDSAGVRIVTYSDLPAVQGASTASTAVLRLGGAEAPPGEEIVYPLGVVAFAADEVWLADVGHRSVRRFGPHGRLTGTVGRSGQGPGEHVYPALMGSLAGDSVVLYDARQRRVTIYTADGALARVVAVPPEVASFFSGIGTLPGGLLAFSRGGGLRLEGRERFVRDTVPVVVLEPEGAPRATFGAVRSPAYWEGPPGASPRALEIPFLPGDHVAAGPSGVVVGSEDRFEVRRYDGTGALESILRITAPTFPVSTEVIDSIREAEAMGSRYPEGVRTLFARMPVADEVPPIAQLAVDAHGRLWLEASATDGDQAQWHLFDPDGTHLMVLSLPRGRLIGLGRDRVALLRYDEYDVPILEIHRIEPPSPPPPRGSAP